jgi:hypothetical protein
MLISGALLFIHYITYRMISLVSKIQQEVQTYRAIIINDNSRVITGDSNITNSMLAPKVASQALEHTPLHVQVSKRDLDKVRGQVMYSDVCLVHTTTTLNIVLAHDTVAFMNSLPALEAADTGDGSSKLVRGIVGVEDIYTVTGIILSVLVWRKDFDSVIDP